MRRWLLEGRVGTAYRHEFHKSEHAAKHAAMDWLST